MRWIRQAAFCYIRNRGDNLKLIINVFGNLLWVLSIFWAYQKISGMKVSQKKMVGVVLLYFLTLLIEKLIHVDKLVLYLSQVTGIHLMLFLGLEIFVVCWIITLLLFDRNIKRSMFLTAAVCTGVQTIFLALNGVVTLVADGDRQLYYFLNFPMTALLLAAVYLIVEKLNLARLFREFEYRNDSFPVTLGITLFILLGYDMLSFLMTAASRSIWTQMLPCLFIIIIFTLSMVYLLNIVSLKDKKKYSDMMLRQQELYIQDLEKIQQNMRVFKHDYKNMMSSIYLQSREGNTEEIEKTISRMIDDFDEEIGKKMNLTNQLANIQMNEVKSLIYQKITIMNQLHITLHLEVLYPVCDVKMNLMDLCRVLGILLDNAIEEVKDQQGDINVVLSSQEEGLHIIVDNQLYHEVNMTDIFKEGCSTKGGQRGMGLFSLGKIIEKYPNVTNAVQIKDHRFIQEIAILKE